MAGDRKARPDLEALKNSLEHFTGELRTPVRLDQAPEAVKWKVFEEKEFEIL